ncbi:hypothetical protein [Haloechinothrix sp. LS1_15]|uniref:hypothetical protein n=1 Tax=Haloechinothrix sp. LS1_15 TaxID=2652248 RepID=UPI0029454941|nr:hypothetical protein [Haloechinothrix sp. LS1_15]MDV6012339.1 hypothetical protein [Haloechinothrix sp. LS1_15]
MSTSAAPDQQPPATREVRPRRRWYVLAAGILAVFLAGAAVLGGWAYVTQPTVAGEVDSGATESVELEREGMTVYTDRQFLQGGCEAHDEEDARVPLEPVTSTETMTADGQLWQVIMRTSGEVPVGEYTVECWSDSDAEFAVGPKASVYTTEGLMLGSATAAGLGMLGAAGVALPVFLRRRSNRKRLAEPAGDADGASGGQQAGPPT